MSAAAPVAPRRSALLPSLRQGGILASIALLVALVVEQFGSASLRQTTTYALVLLVIVVALYCFSGLTGIVSFGHLGFVALGAYVGALLTIQPALKTSLFSEMPGWLDWILDMKAGLVVAAIAAGLFAAVIAAILAVPLARLDGMAASISTLAFLEIVQNVLLHWDEVTRGSSSVIGVPKQTTLMVAAATAGAVLLLVALVDGSRLGLRLRAARADAAAAQACGARVVADRRWALVVSAFIAGVAGSLFAQFNTTFSPNTFDLGLTFTVVAMLVIGGMTKLPGTLVGVALVTVVTETVQSVQDYGFGPIDSLPAGAPQLAVALVLIVVLIARPAGIMGGPVPGRRPLMDRLDRWRTPAPKEG